LLLWCWLPWKPGHRPGDLGLNVEETSAKYVDVKIEDLAHPGVETYDTVSVRIFYTVDELDRNGDGDASDLSDLNESRLQLFIYDTGNNTWSRLDTSLDWVKEVGVNTTDIVVYGTSYAGYVWVTTSHTGLFSIVASNSNATALVGDVKGDSTLLKVGVVCAALISAVTLIVVMRRRRR
jgi:hypothetical protein